MNNGVETEAAVPAVQGLGRRALSLGAANAIDYAAQFLLPVVLARSLDTDAFGEYRLLWLAVGTVAGVVTLAMPASLHYYLPRSDAAAKRLYINQTLAYLLLAGLVSAWVLSAWNPWLPEKLHGLARHQAIVPAFVLLWVLASLLDLLPTVEERVTWQARATVGLATLRAVALSAAAALTGELEPVLLVLAAFVAFKFAVLLCYVVRYHGLSGPILRLREFAAQLRFAAPLGAAGVAYGLRVQVDQWIAAALFPLAMFASFSIAAALAPLMTLFRHSVNYAFLPSMSRMEAAGDIAGLLRLNSRANILVGSLVYPLLAFAFVFAEELVTLVYTAAYLDAAPVMRLYIVGLAALVVELASITMLLRLAGFVTALNLAALLVAAPVNWVAAHHIGLAGAALGSVAMVFADRLLTLWRIARRCGVPVGRLQDWRALGRLLGFAALAAGLAWAAVERYFGASGPLVRVCVGGTLLFAGYAALNACFGSDAGGLRAARNAVRGQ
jgi:O-antigen/teichoic acid export membrane protein